MPWGDVRGLLQYVPQFRDKVFVVIVNAPESALAETMLDLVTLQNIGVQLAIGSTVLTTDELLDRAAEVELKFSQAALTAGANPGEALSALQRGQAVFLENSGKNPLSPDLVVPAKALSAKKIILLHEAGERIPRGAIRAAEIEADQSPLLRSAAAACSTGIPRIHLLDGNTPGALLSELFSNEGVGTMVYADSYRIIRSLREEDVVELLGMIGRSVRNACLVPRDYAEVVNRMEDYWVMEIDGNVVGSVALYHYGDDDLAEIACLYVKQAHEGMGYGAELVRHAEQRARDAGIPSVFALTNRAANFFQKLGYGELPLEEIPEARRKQLLASGRDSRVLGKMLA